MRWFCGSIDIKVYRNRSNCCSSIGNTSYRTGRRNQFTSNEDRENFQTSNQRENKRKTKVIFWEIALDLILRQFHTVQLKHLRSAMYFVEILKNIAFHK